MNNTVPIHSVDIQRFSLRVEAALRHSFLAELYSYLWKLDSTFSLQVFTADADDMGFDLLLTANSQIRHVQLKSSFIGSTTRAVRIRDSLWKQKGGCTIGCHYAATDLNIRHYSFFGFTHDNDSENVDLKLFPLARHTKANAKGEKKTLPGMRVVRWDEFDQNLDIAAVAYRLFRIQKPAKPLD